MKNQKGSIKIILPLSFIILIIIAGLYFYINNKTTKRYPADQIRTYYEGYVQIEPIVISEIINRLEKTGCTKEGKTCHYILDTSSNSLLINLFGKDIYSFGPGARLKISDNKLYSSNDITGKRDIEIFKSQVRKDLAQVGNVVTPIEKTWKITFTRDSSGIWY